MNDEQIDAVFNTMPHGVSGFCKDWGYRHFAHAILDAAGHNSETSQLVRLMERVKDLPPMTADQLFEQRVSWSWSVLGDPKVTKDQVRAILLKREGR